MPLSRDDYQEESGTLFIAGVVGLVTLASLVLFAISPQSRALFSINDPVALMNPSESAGGTDHPEIEEEPGKGGNPTEFSDPDSTEEGASRRSGPENQSAAEGEDTTLTEGIGGEATQENSREALADAGLARLTLSLRELENLIRVNQTAVSEYQRTSGQDLTLIAERLRATQDSVQTLDNALASIEARVNEIVEDRLERIDASLSRLAAFEEQFERFSSDELVKIRRELETRKDAIFREPADDAQENNVEMTPLNMTQLNASNSTDESQQAPETSLGSGEGYLVIDNPTKRTVAIEINGYRTQLTPGRNKYVVPIGNLDISGDGKSWRLDRGWWKRLDGEPTLHWSTWPL